MRRFLQIGILTVCACAVFVISASAQQYGYYYYPPVAVPPNWNPYGYQYGPQPVLKYRLAPDPRTIRKWDSENRMLDYEALMRGPLNPEGSVDYMLRNFQ
jgi:hypothetical protein